MEDKPMLLETVNCSVEILPDIWDNFLDSLDDGPLPQENLQGPCEDGPLLPENQETVPNIMDETPLALPVANTNIDAENPMPSHDNVQMNGNETCVDSPQTHVEDGPLWEDIQLLLTSQEPVSAKTDEAAPSFAEAAENPLLSKYSVEMNLDGNVEYDPDLLQQNLQDLSGNSLQIVEDGSIMVENLHETVQDEAAPIEAENNIFFILDGTHVHLRKMCR